MTRIDPPIGCTADDIDTPYLHLDLDAMEFNTAQMVLACSEYGIEWRPHSKCHKSPEIARRLIEAGAIGMTCAKLGEAEIMAAAGIRDLLIANLLAGPIKCRRLAALCAVADPIITVDHVDQLQPIADALRAARQRVRVILEVDIGMQRVGVGPGEPAVDLARRIVRHDPFDFVGIMGYEGHLLLVPDAEEKRTRIFEAIDRLSATRDALRDAGLRCDIVSCGGTGSFEHTIQHPAVTELQAGGAIFMDAYYRQKCGVRRLQQALTVVSTVVSRPAADRAVMDAGRKTVNMEFEMPAVAGRDDVTVSRLSAEHGLLQVTHEAAVAIGDRLHIIPGYADLTNNLHDKFYAFRAGRLEQIFPITARGHVW